MVFLQSFSGFSHISFPTYFFSGLFVEFFSVLTSFCKIRKRFSTIWAYLKIFNMFFSIVSMFAFIYWGLSQRLSLNFGILKGRFQAFE